MAEKDWQFYIDVMKKIIKRMLPNFGGDIVTGMRLIEEQLAQKEARIRELEGFNPVKRIRENCPCCDNGVTDVDRHPVYREGDEGEAVIDHYEDVAIQCQYCSELIEALSEEDK